MKSLKRSELTSLLESEANKIWLNLKILFGPIIRRVRNLQLNRLIRMYERDARDFAAERLHRSAAFSRFMAERLKRELRD